MNLLSHACMHAAKGCYSAKTILKVFPRKCIPTEYTRYTVYESTHNYTCRAVDVFKKDPLLHFVLIANIHVEVCGHSDLHGFGICNNEYVTKRCQDVFALNNNKHTRIRT